MVDVSGLVYDNLISISKQFCYNPKLDSSCNLDKDLSKSKKDDQLVKHKDTGLYLLLYISTDHKGRKRCP